MGLWPNQERALTELPKRMAPERSVCVTSPTGTGKSVIMCELLKQSASGGASLYTNRKMLLDQMSGVMDKEGIRHGIRAAGHLSDLDEPIQLCSVQTVLSRSIKKRKWPIPESKLVIIDEAHVNKEASAAEIIKRHHNMGACLVGFTATPLNIGHIYDDLLVAGNVSEGRECGALVPAYHFAPDEPDMRKLKRKANGDYTTRDIVNAMMTHCIVGRVIDNWRKLNPEGKPTLLFAPGVPQSLWFAEQLTKEGIPAAHIDGDNVWVDGEMYESDHEAREAVRDRLKAGDIKIVCNRFVLREGIDWPFVEHMIFATIFGALTSYLQSGGRGMRACPETGKQNVIVQDHGGNWHKNGSLNADREWMLDYTDYVVGEMRENRFREKKSNEPVRCHQCNMIRSWGKECVNCGAKAASVSSRMVVQKDGSLREMKGDVYKPRRTDKWQNVADIWKQYYYRGRKKSMTFNQARGLYQYENNWLSPPEGLPLMPVRDMDWYLPIDSVPMERLHGYDEAVKRKQENLFNKRGAA